MKTKPTKIIIAVSSAIILLSSCAERDKTSPEPPSTGDIISASLPTEVSTEPTPELTTVEDTQISTEPSTEPTTEPSTQPTTEATTTKPTEKTTEKTTAKTTQKTTAKTQKTKSTTTEKPKTSQTTAEDVPQPEPEAIAERLEKLTPELREWVANAQPDELIRIEVLIARPTDEEIDARVLAEYGLSYPYSEPDMIPVVGPVEDGASTASVPEEMKYFDAFDEVKSDEYVSRIEAFLDGFVPEERKPVWYTKYSTSIYFEANVGEILLYTSAPQVERIYMNEISYDDVSEPEPSDEEEIIEASDPTITD